MRTAIVAGLAVAGALSAAGPPVAAAAPTTRATLGCDDASTGSFTTTSGAVRFGVFDLGGGSSYSAMPVEQLRRLQRAKMQLLLEPGHTVTLAVAPSHRHKAAWAADGEPGLDTRPGLERTAAVLTLRACPDGYPYKRSRFGGRTVTFWASGLRVTTVPQCVPITVRVAGERRARRETVGVGRTCG